MSSQLSVLGNWLVTILAISHLHVKISNTVEGQANISALAET